MINFKSAIPVILLIGLVSCSGDPVDPVKGKIETALLTHFEGKVTRNLEYQRKLQKSAQALIPEGEEKEMIKKRSEEGLRNNFPTDISISVIEHDCSDINDNVKEIVCTVKYERSSKIRGSKLSKSVNSKVTFSQTNGVWKQESET